MSASIAGNSAPFCNTEQRLPSYTAPPVRPARACIPSHSDVSRSSCRCRYGVRRLCGSMKPSIASTAPASIQPRIAIPIYEAGSIAVPLPGVGAQQRSIQARCDGMITDLWYKNAVIYSLDLETFMDGNGDGCGDFQGLMQRLDYLDSLGIDLIWLAPFQPSPNRDNGYDISDFYGVDPRHGSSGEFVEFMNHANKRGIGVILDLVVNHTSDP